MGGTDDFVVLPAVSVAFLPHPVLVAQFAKTIGKRFVLAGEVGHPLQKMTHFWKFPVFWNEATK